jgi:DNA-binding MarR family transcriptional regulator
MLKLMEKNGLISRVAVDYDARLKKIVLTEKAIQIHQKATHNIELLEEADAMAEQEAENATTIPSNTQPSNDMTLELVQKMVDWDRRKRILEDWKWNVMNDVVQGRKPFTDRMKYAFYLNLEKLKKNGFEE